LKRRRRRRRRRKRRIQIGLVMKLEIHFLLKNQVPSLWILKPNLIKSEK